MSTVLVDQFVSRRIACRILGGISHHRFEKVRPHLPVRTWELPGVPARYHRGDLEAVAQSMVRMPEPAAV